MGHLTALILFCCAGFLLISRGSNGAEPDIDESDVVVLTEKNFDATVKNAPFALVEFYAPWCGHCKSLAPEYAAAATELKESHPDIVIGKIDATAEEKLAKEYGVSGYPTLKWFVKGNEPVDFGGGRTASEIVQWIVKKTGPPAVTLEAVEAAKKIISSAELFLLGFFPNFEGDMFTEFLALANANDAIPFYQTSSPEVAKLLGLGGEEAEVAVGRNFGDGFEAIPSKGHAAFEGDVPLSSKLAFFLLQEKLPAYVEFNEASSKLIFGSGIINQVIVIAPKKALDPAGPLIAGLRAVHASQKGRIVAVTSVAGDKGSEAIANYFGASAAAKEPQVFGFNLEAGKKYLFSGKPTTEALVKFAADLIDGKLTPQYKSEEPPASPAKPGEVVVVTGKTLDAIVKDPTKDVLLEIYAPWCGHCKKLEPKYVKLAKRFKKIRSVVIAKFDGTANEHADIDVKGFPAIKFFPAGEGSEPIDFEGDRSLKALTKFLTDNAKIPFTLPKKKQEDEEGKDEL